MSHFAFPKLEMNIHAEVALPAGGNIFKSKKLVVTKEGMKYIPGSSYK